MGKLWDKTVTEYLKPQQTGAGRAGKLIASGTGFGTKVLSKKSNVLRALMLSASGQEDSTQNVIYQIDFDVDDQSAEDLAIGLDHIRSIHTVLDVAQAATFGKKGRLATTIRVLAEMAQIDQVFDACFFETSTFGSRNRCCRGKISGRRKVS